MTMLKEMRFTEARQQLTTVLDEVQSLLPSIIKARKKTETDTLLITKNMFQDLLSMYKFKTEFLDEEEGAFSCWIEPLDLYGYGETKEEALNDLINEVLEYSKEFLENRSLFLNTPNRKGHLPYVLRILLSDSRNEVIDLIFDGRQTA